MTDRKHGQFFGLGYINTISCFLRSWYWSITCSKELYRHVINQNIWILKTNLMVRIINSFHSRDRTTTQNWHIIMTIIIWLCYLHLVKILTGNKEVIIQILLVLYYVISCIQVDEIKIYILKYNSIVNFDYESQLTKLSKNTIFFLR